MGFLFWTFGVDGGISYVNGVCSSIFASEIWKRIFGSSDTSDDAVKD